MSPHCCCPGADWQVLKESWNLLPDKVQGVFFEAEYKLGALNSIDLRDKRSLAVGESLLLSLLCGARFSAQFLAAVSLEATPKGFQSSRL
jgi:hypothetical protein